MTAEFPKQQLLWAVLEKLIKLTKGDGGRFPLVISRCSRQLVLQHG
jgi:hypothetical protein